MTLPAASASGPTPEAMDRVARAALELVQDGMLLGLGTGRAAEALIARLGERVAGGLRIRAVTTSERSEQLAGSLGIPLGTLGEIERLDLDFDGADEVTPELFLTKGRGGALVRERVVAHAAARFVVLCTPDKLVRRIGERSPIPIVVVPFAAHLVAREVERLGGQPQERLDADGQSYRTDDGGLILDARFEPVAAPHELERALRQIPGVIDTGLFLGMAERALCGWPDRVQTIAAPTG
jgi:ribose 5-phosphate isomerase A